MDRGQVFQRRKNMHSQTHEKKEKCVFFSFRFDKNCKSELQRDAEKLSRESAN